MKKEELRQKAQNVLDEVNEGIDKLEVKMQDIGDDVKEEYSKQLENLKEIKSNLMAKLQEIDGIADSKWDIVKESAWDFYNSVSASWKENSSKVAQAFKKTTDKVKDVFDGDEEQQA